MRHPDGAPARAEVASGPGWGHCAGTPVTSPKPSDPANNNTHATSWVEPDATAAAPASDEGTARTRVMGKTEALIAAGPVVGKRFGDFLLMREIGRGGMGAVFEARQIGLDRRVALKLMLRPEPVMRERFTREAKALALVDSPHVVKVHHAGQIGDDLYFAMEFVDGTDLALRLRAGWRPTHAEAVNLILQAARGLAAAAAHGLIHRDIKPGNLILAADGTLKVADFGLVRMASEGEQLTQTGTVMGTVNYFSPEQGMGGRCDPRSDIYSLGVVFYELLTGVLPFHGESAAAIIYQHVHVEPRAPQNVDPTIPAACQAVVLRCLHKRATERYQNANELIAALALIDTRTPPKPRRSRRSATAAALAAILLIAGVGAWGWHVRADAAAPATDPAIGVAVPADLAPAVGADREGPPADVATSLRDPLRVAAESLAPAEPEPPSDTPVVQAPDATPPTLVDAPVDATPPDAALAAIAPTTGTEPTEAPADLPAETVAEDPPATPADTPEPPVDHPAAPVEPIVAPVAAVTATVEAAVAPIEQVVAAVLPPTPPAPPVEEPRAAEPAVVPMVPAVPAKDPSQPSAPPGLGEVARDAYGWHADLVVDGVALRFRWCPPGEFEMGSRQRNAARRGEAAHRVRLNSGFWLAESETPQAFWARIMRDQPSKMRGEQLPTHNLSFADCTTFLTLLGERFPGLAPRLPWEYEWEYACRAGGVVGGDEQDAQANIAERHRRLLPVADGAPNQWGLRHMIGNVAEWCADSYAPITLAGAVTDPRPTGGKLSVCRGGCWEDDPEVSRPASRRDMDPGYGRTASTGLRIALDAPAP